jgi:hypothetical protein
MNAMVRRLLIVLAGILLAIAVVLYVLQYLQREAAPLAEAPANTAPSGVLPSAGSLPTAPGGTAAVNVPAAAPAEPAQPPQASEEELLTRSLVVAARDFTERYGSYSSEGEFRNLEALLPVMTARFRSETEAYIARERARPTTGEFVGVTTRALNAVPSGAVTAGSPVTVRALAQRTTVDAAGERVGYETLVLVLRYVGAVWQIDSARWESA